VIKGPLDQPPKIKERWTIMRRLLIVSNRLPVTIEKRKDGLHFPQSPGGLATGLGSFYRSYDSMWIGWPGITSDKINKEEEKWQYMNQVC